LIQAARHIAADSDFSKTESGSRAKKVRAGHKKT
jgi:hypothetical protein